ncbi:MAG: hypothetical protein ACLVKO_02980 [Dysgonomonas sp.]
MNNWDKTIHSGLLIITLLFLCSSAAYAQTAQEDSIPLKASEWVKKSIYDSSTKKHGSFYNYVWGKHYRDIYYTPVSVRAIPLNTLFGGLTYQTQIPKLHGMLFKNKSDWYYFLKPIGGGSSSFSESGFFQSIYNRRDFKDTYLGGFIADAFTMQHPYAFLATEHLAKGINMLSHDPQLIYVTGTSECDTIADGSPIENKIIGIYKHPALKNKDVTDSIPLMLEHLHEADKYDIDRKKYVRIRLFDMLVGDWNKIPENWLWIGDKQEQRIIYQPVVLDRSNTFTKVDGLLFQQLLNMLGLNFITDFEENIKNVKKFNSLAYTLDVALVNGIDENTWVGEAEKLKSEITDQFIKEAFNKLPKEIDKTETEKIKTSLMQRRNNLGSIARRYYRELQKNPSIAGSYGDDRFVIEYDSSKNVRIQIFTAKENNLILDKKYFRKETREIWLYGLNGNDTFEVRGNSNGIPIFLIGGKGDNKYQIESETNVKIYEYESQKQRLNSLSKVKIIYPSNADQSLAYDYEKLRYTKFSITPIGIYDSDLGLNIGTSLAYTIYGFRRSPYTRRHQLSYNYVEGFTYQGIFPDYDSRRSFHVSAFVGSPEYFSNFFGYGNNTSGFKDEKNNYNRVHLNKYTLTPAIYYTISDNQEFNIYSSFEIYKVNNPKGRDRYINVWFKDKNSVFDTKFFTNIGATYRFDKKMNQTISHINMEFNAGWAINWGDLKRNFPYAKADFGMNVAITDRITFATKLKGHVLFNDKYEFYQSATTELRGFRDNRFIGRQSFYQYSDFRLDMGQLKNPFTPLGYGVFAGIDYGRVWWPEESSKKWHTSYGGGFWLTLFRNFTGKFSYFASTDTGRFMFELGMGF